MKKDKPGIRRLALPFTWNRLPGRRTGNILALTLASLLLVSCSSEENSPAPPPSQESIEPKASIPIFNDVQFHHRIGEVATYSIICVYRKDEDNPSIQPKNALAYWVQPTDPPLVIRGFVDPERAGIVTGISPDCETYSGAPLVPEPNPSPSATIKT